MTFLGFLRARPTTPVMKLDCPFCPGGAGASGPMCSVCRQEALHLGRLRP